MIAVGIAVAECLCFFGTAEDAGHVGDGAGVGSDAFHDPHHDRIALAHCHIPGRLSLGRSSPAFNSAASWRALTTNESGVLPCVRSMCSSPSSLRLTTPAVIFWSSPA